MKLKVIEAGDAKKVGSEPGARARVALWLKLHASGFAVTPGAKQADNANGVILGWHF